MDDNDEERCEQDYLTFINGIPVCKATGSKCCIKCHDYQERCKTPQCPAMGFEGKEVVDCFKVALHIRAGEYLTKGDNRYHKAIQQDLKARDHLISRASVRRKEGQVSQIRETFVNHCITLLKEEGMKQEDIEMCLRSAWDHGACTALYLPWAGFDEVSQSRRDSFARYVLETLILDELGAEGEEALSEEELDEILQEYWAAEQVLPGTILSAEKGWILGMRSNN